MTSAKPAPLNRLRQLWREGRPTFGAIATIPSIQTVQIMARSGIDWIIVDLEHGPIDLGSHPWEERRAIDSDGVRYIELAEPQTGLLVSVACLRDPCAEDRRDALAEEVASHARTTGPP